MGFMIRWILIGCMDLGTSSAQAQGQARVVASAPDRPPPQKLDRHLRRRGPRRALLPHRDQAPGPRPQLPQRRRRRPPPPLDLSGHAFAPYTSLKDLLPAASPSASSPTAAASSSNEISIRNRLVNRAAWAYLRPMSASPGSHGPDLLRRLWLRLSACLGFIRRAFGRIVRFFSPVRSGR
ncbi:uncharacterized protein LOC115753898 [Rhodamnia argentea]|uniref:Uncharacterized protein LOC115753898 n=1 Tax=Rhodamnia argentea TaxID=178133 RepID=A0ABM3GTU7_9MYRT|nr:uncharacterized protein LOC115753898 [Rhodamnia argentea]